MTHKRIEASEVKARARGQWPDILVMVAGIPRELLDGKHHPCPKCGGKDRFRLIDENAGVLLCNQCFKRKNGDGIAAIMHYAGYTFPQALKLVADFLGMALQSAPKGRLSALELICGSKRMPKESATSYGACERNGVVVFPSWKPDGTRAADFTIRPVGSEKERKGMWPKGGAAGVFLPVQVDGTPRLPQPGETWLVVEGVKDAAALHSLGYLAMGMPTCSLAQKFVRMLRGVNVVLVPDRDTASIDGAEKTARFLCGVSASTKLAALPAEVTQTHGKDVRDILAQESGEQHVREAIEQAQPWHKPGETSSKALVRRLADAISAELHFAQDGGKRIYVFKDGAYRLHGEEAIRRKVKTLCQAWGVDGSWSSHLANEVAEYIRVDCRPLWDRPPGDVINLMNGLLRIVDRKLLPHSAEYLSTVQLPVKFDPKATCPATEKFVSEVFPEDSTILAWQIVAYLMVAQTYIQKAVLLLGPGGNGKSTWLAQVLAFLGNSNTSSVSLHKLEADKFAAARLYGKLAIICPDLPSDHLCGTSTFKSITGGDVIQGEFKFKDSFDFVPFARLLFSANSPPLSRDASPGFFERWLVIPFERSIRGTAQEVPRHVLDAKLSSPTELSGLLNKALEALPTITKGFAQPKSVQDAWQEFHATTDPLAVWIDQNTIDTPQAVVARRELRLAFNRSLERQGRPAMSETAFGLSFTKLRPHVKTKQRTVNGRLQWCYVGIGLVTTSDDGSRGSQGSQG